MEMTIFPFLYFLVKLKILRANRHRRVYFWLLFSSFFTEKRSDDSKEMKVKDSKRIILPKAICYDIYCWWEKETPLTLAKLTYFLSFLSNSLVVVDLVGGPNKLLTRASSVPYRFDHKIHLGDAECIPAGIGLLWLVSFVCSLYYPYCGYFDWPSGIFLLHGRFALSLSINA